MRKDVLRISVKRLRLNLGILLTVLLANSYSAHASDESSQLIEYIKAHTATTYIGETFKAYTEVITSPDNVCVFKARRIVKRSEESEIKDYLANLSDLNQSDIEFTQQKHIWIFTKDRNNSATLIMSGKNNPSHTSWCKGMMSHAEQGGDRNTYMSGKSCISELASNHIEVRAEKGYEKEVASAMRKLVSICGGVAKSPPPKINSYSSESTNDSEIDSFSPSVIGRDNDGGIRIDCGSSRHLNIYEKSNIYYGPKGASSTNFDDTVWESCRLQYGR